ncbi:hypothetical protein H4R34_000282 [Dimargaris verticillata]|uniref:Uncharacterized protein n=1 Tax=Dimargaris verticillata TaxID=2761393 RepID=A0A9W8BCY0_9FUNG|nr:hypothetical protein H4R34_000282 [Dimargaris verticillata]
MDIPKVQVEAREDVLFLKSEFRKSVHQCLDSNRHLQRCREQSADKETDAQQHYTQLTGDIDTLISQWVDNIFQLAGPNIQVNGLEYNQAMRPNVVMDDYDESLHQETQQLQAEVEALTILVAEQRKTIPDMLETAVARQLEHRLQHLNDDLTGTNGTRNPPPVTNSQSPGSGKTASPVPERTRAEFDQALGSLLELQKVNTEHCYDAYVQRQQESFN